MMVCALVMSVAMQAATELVLDVNDAQVTYYSSDFYSQEDWYCYHMVLQHQSTDPRDEFPILSFTIYQTTNKGLVAGKYSLDDDNLSEVVLTRDLYDAIAQELGGYTWKAIAAETEVVVNGDGTTTIKVAMEDAEGVKYSAELTKKIQVVESKQHPYNDPYIFENQKAQEFDVTMDTLLWDDRQFYSEKTMRLELRSNNRKPDSTFYSTVLWINTASQIPTAGTYPIAGKGEIGTVDASIGYDSIQNIIYPTYFGLSDDLGRMYDPELYFLVTGKVEISYPAEDVIRIEVDATSWWKSHVKCVYEGKIGYAPAETKTYDVTLGKESDLMNKCYPGVFDYSIQLSGTDKDGVTYSVYIDLLPEQEKLVGEYSRADRTFYTDASAIQRGKEAARHIADGAISVTMDEKGLYAIKGYMIDMQGDRFNIQGEGIVIEFVSEEAYRYELENTRTMKIKTVFSDIIWDQSTVERDQYLTITLVNKKANSDGFMEEAVFWMSTPTAVFPAGDYPINSTADFFTFYASPGSSNGGISPCLYYTYDKKGIQEVWFLTDGKVTINYPTDKTISVEVHATSYFGSEINLYYNVPGMGVEEVVRDGAARKVVRDGELRIEMNGVEYNVLGTRL